MINNNSPRHAVATTDGRRIEDLIELIDALIDVVTEENIALAMGLPASQSQHTARKLELADLFEMWVKEVSMKNLLHTPNRPLQQKVLGRIDRLRVSTDENMTRLRAAIEASQRRIDAVMNAIRAQISDNSPYGASGRINGSAASYARGLSA
ncbi:flagellar protein FlgN [Rhodopseudomonas sp. P2A-2r]|uniref:flagellar protein FlgN n=1 Tax=unclassified Rhodopseudomonas TaxID=2638247 RepID=UPI0022345F9E|nr:flagellar protein FlgN [Rhodopseudomonas sp. P2A-2r]UZE49960.1 flagellar protein FlgN [Rhodopseudomonas sp. P2A-2r]